LIYIVIALQAMTVIGGDQPVRFQGAIQSLPSPNRRLAVINVDPDHGDDMHSLVLIDTATGRRRLLHRYPRWVAVLWSPDSQWVAVTDYSGSDESTVLVYASATLKMIDLRKYFERHSKVIRTLLMNHHSYVVGTRFTDSSGIRVNINGYGDQAPRGFSCCYDVSLPRLEVIAVKCDER